MGILFSMEAGKPIYTMRRGRRYRLKFRNANQDIHPLHLHRHSIELTSFAGQPTSGVSEEVVLPRGLPGTHVRLVADNPGRTLFHLHQQLHMDFGFMALFD